MVSTCFACKWRSDKYPRRSYHRFPLKNELRQKWLDILGKSDATLGRRTFLCCVHFTEDCFRYGLVMGTKILKRGSLPTLHLTKDEIRDQTAKETNLPENAITYILPTSQPKENYVNEEPTYEMNDEDKHEEVPIEYTTCTISPTKRELYDYPLAIPSQASVDVKPFIHNLSFALNTESQSSGLVYTPLIQNNESYSSPETTSSEDSSFFTFFRYIHSDYLMLSEKGQKQFKKKCLDILHTMLNDEFTIHRPNYSDHDNISNLSTISQEDKDVKPLLDHDYILPI